MGMKQSVSMHIEELVLHGFQPAQRRRIAAAVEKELARLIREQGVPQLLRNPASLGRMNAGTIGLRANQTAAATGVGISQAIYRSFDPREVSKGR
jgi:hypothetical protein